MPTATSTWPTCEGKPRNSTPHPLAAVDGHLSSTHGVFLKPASANSAPVVHRMAARSISWRQSQCPGGARPSRVVSAPMSATSTCNKTFCIPHGGGGPGVGDRKYAPHLVPFLSRPPHTRCRFRGLESPGDRGRFPPRPGASAGILPISWMYVRMMGGAGLVRPVPWAPCWPAKP